MQNSIVSVDFPSHSTDANPAALQQHFYGQSEKVIEALFSLATKVQPCIIFIDEIDTLLGYKFTTHIIDVSPSLQKQKEDQKRTHGSSSRNVFEVILSILNHLIVCSLWDGMHSRKDNKITLVGATNRPDELGTCEIYEHVLIDLFR